MTDIYINTSDKRLAANQKTQKRQAVEDNVKTIQSLEPRISDKRVAADQETQKGQAVEDHFKGSNIDAIA